MSEQLNKQDIMINLPGVNAKICMTRIVKGDESSRPVVLIPGNMENARIFYSETFKGFAPYLAKCGFTVYCVDTRGKGKSFPNTSKDFDYTQKDLIHDLLEVYKKVDQLHPAKSQVWGSHSWGGVLVNCFLLRYPELISKIDSLIHFGVKRSIQAKSLKKFMMINLGMKYVLRLQSAIDGYIKPHFFGDESESRSYIKDVNSWIDLGDFVCPEDGLNYGEAASKINLPRGLYIAGGNDPVLGNMIDIEYFIKECHHKNSEVWKMSRANGFLEDYTHTSMLTSKSAVDDHFPKILNWIESNSNT